MFSWGLLLKIAGPLLLAGGLYAGFHHYNSTLEKYGAARTALDQCTANLAQSEADYQAAQQRLNNSNERWLAMVREAKTQQIKAATLAAEATKDRDQVTAALAKARREYSEAAANDQSLDEYRHELKPVPVLNRMRTALSETNG